MSGSLTLWNILESLEQQRRVSGYFGPVVDWRNKLGTRTLHCAHCAVQCAEKGEEKMIDLFGTGLHRLLK